MLNIISVMKNSPSALKRFLSFKQRNNDFYRSFGSVEMSQEVSTALRDGQPVVALESTIITHGMPYPANLETAINVENVIRSKGAIPATIGIIKGRVYAGLSQEQIEELATMKEPCLKTSRRDFPFVLSQKLNGGTTVSGTMLVASKANIPIFVTGGIGGVHRGASESFDVSADLTELGRTPVAVISSGVKSILDIGKTLEYLETQGVCVATLSTDKDRPDFPAFFTRSSGFLSPHRVKDPSEAASLIHETLSFSLGNGLLIAVPIPEVHQADGRAIEDAIQTALRTAEKKRILGKDVTPFILSEVNRLTSGASLVANMALIQHNAAVGASVAVELAQIRHRSSFQPRGPSSAPLRRDDCSTVVIGGSIVDLVANVQEDAILMDGSTHRGSIRTSYGGVGRNLADGLSRLRHPPLFLSVVGEDASGRDLIHHNPSMESRGILRLRGSSTATYVVILDREGDFKFGIGDMKIHEELTVDKVKPFERDMASSRMVIMDGNLALSTIDYILDVCKSARVPVWFEPTDVHKAWKPFRNPEEGRWSALAYTSPNLAELKQIVETIRPGTFKNSSIVMKDSQDRDGFRQAIVEACLPILDRMHCVMITLGKEGMMIVRRGSKDQQLPLAPWTHESDLDISWTHYPAPDVQNIVSVSGAGDCLAAGFITGILNGWKQDECAQLGIRAAKCSIQHSPAVPSTLSEILNI